MKSKKSSKHEDKCLLVLRQLLPEREPVLEYRFHIPYPGEKQRKWRFDFAYPDLKLAFEVEGAIWTGGRHVNPIGFSKDCEKYNEAARQGWTVYRLTPTMINLPYLESLLFTMQTS